MEPCVEGSKENNKLSETAIDEDGENDGKLQQVCEAPSSVDCPYKSRAIVMDRNSPPDKHSHLPNGDVDSMHDLEEKNSISGFSESKDCTAVNGESGLLTNTGGGDHQYAIHKNLEKSVSISAHLTATVNKNSFSGDSSVAHEKMDICSDNSCSLQVPTKCLGTGGCPVIATENSHETNSVIGLKCSVTNTSNEETPMESNAGSQIQNPENCDKIEIKHKLNDDLLTKQEKSKNLSSETYETAESSLNSISRKLENSVSHSRGSTPDNTCVVTPVQSPLLTENISTDCPLPSSLSPTFEKQSNAQAQTNPNNNDSKSESKSRVKIIPAQTSNKTIPKARKSGLPQNPNSILTSTIRTVNLAPIANLTVRLPADSAHLLDSKPKTILPVSKAPSLSKPKKPLISPLSPRKKSPLSPNKKSPLSKFRRKRRRRVRYGTYNLPNERKIKKKKKDENSAKSDESDSDEKSDEKEVREKRSKRPLVDKESDNNVKLIKIFPNSPSSLSSSLNHSITTSSATISTCTKTTSALDYLTQNSHRAFEQGTPILTKKIGNRKMIIKSPVLKQKTVSEMILEKQIVSSTSVVVGNTSGQINPLADVSEPEKKIMKRKSDGVIASTTPAFIPIPSKVPTVDKRRKIDGPSPKQIPIAPAAPSFITLNGATVLANIQSPQSVPQTIPVNVAAGAHNTSVIRLAFVSKNNLILPPSNPSVTSTPKSFIIGPSKISPTMNITSAGGNPIPSVFNLVPVVQKPQTLCSILSTSTTVTPSAAAGNKSTSLLAVELTKPMTGTSVSSQQTTTVTNSTSLLKFVTVASSTSVQSPISSLSPSQQSPLLSQIVSSTPLCFKTTNSIGTETTYPVTPPKTPDQGLSEINCPPTGIPTSPDRDIIPLCCCKLNGASFNKLSAVVSYCQALDSVDGKVMGCCNKISNALLVRPAVKIPFMAFCESHRRRLRQHNCCPGCGHFCTQGKYYQCKKDPGLSAHHYHKQCQVFRDGRYFCPHCGEESMQFEVSLALHEPRSLSMAENQKPKIKQNTQKAKMNRRLKMKNIDAEEEKAVTQLLEKLNKTLSSAGLSGYPEKEYLDKVLLDLTSGDRPKKYKLMTKNLYDAAYSADLDKCVFLLADGLDPNEKNPDYEDQYPLHASAESGSLAITNVLLQAGANVHCVDKNLRTPLMLACENNHLRIVKFLLGSGAVADSKDQDGMDALHYAAKAGHTTIIKYLLDYGKVNVNSEDNGGWTAIIWAAEHRFVDTVRYLLHCGADPNKKDKEENTSLHWASFSGSVIIAEIFLDYGCNIESVNQNGDRPLHIAARQHHYECVVLLLARGADTEAKNNGGEMPIDCCADKNSAVGVALQVNKQLKSFAMKRFGRTERLMHRDITLGKENVPIPCLNGVDDMSCPTDYQYITENVETTPLSINRTINSLHSCRCKDDCASLLCNCGRNSVKVWYDDGGRLAETVSHLDPPLIFECNRACRCWTTCNNRVVQHGLRSRLQLVRTEGRGWGVQTVLDIPKGTFICEYIGELITDCEADSRENDSYLFDLDNKDGDTYCIDARQYGNIARFINHLCEPNIIPVKVFIHHQDLRFPHICFFASRDIKAYEELGFDYGEKFWIIKWKQFTCACGSPKCKYSKDTIHKTLEEYQSRHEEDECPTPEVPGPSAT